MHTGHPYQKYYAKTSHTPIALWNEKQNQVEGREANNDLQKCKVLVVAVTV